MYEVKTIKTNTPNKKNQTNLESQVLLNFLRRYWLTVKCRAGGRIYVFFSSPFVFCQGCWGNNADSMNRWKERWRCSVSPWHSVKIGGEGGRGQTYKIRVCAEKIVTDRHQIFDVPARCLSLLILLKQGILTPRRRSMRVTWRRGGVRVWETGVMYLTLKSSQLGLNLFNRPLLSCTNSKVWGAAGQVN